MRRNRHRSPDASKPVAVILLAAFLIMLALSVVLADPADGREPPPIIPAKIAKEARWLAKHGGVTGSCHGCATPRMKQLVTELILARFRPQGAAVQRLALCIANGESGLNPGAISSTSDYGVFQINRPSWGRTYDWSRILDPVYNIGVGWAMSQRGSNWHPWVVYTNGSCGY